MLIPKILHDIPALISVDVHYRLLIDAHYFGAVGDLDLFTGIQFVSLVDLLLMQEYKNQP
jgi:hypothetical protein